MGRKQSAGGRLERDTKDRTITYTAPRIITEQDAVKKAKLDLRKWKIERAVYNSWEVGAKGPDGRVVVTPLWQVKLWVAPREAWTTDKFKAQLIRDIRKASVPRPRIRRAPKTGFLAELSIADPHFGKLCWDDETGNNYDLSVASRLYRDAVDDLLQSVQSFALDRILFPIGNDLLHVDNHKNTTAAGTPQDVDGRWQKAFRQTRLLLTETIEKLREVAPVDVLVVPGNHDLERSFYIGECLEAQYSRDKDVRVDNRPTLRKYYTFGRVLLGFTHGNEEKHQNLPGIMADECTAWSSTYWREWHVGHFHKSKSTHFVVSEDTYGTTVVRVLPSISGLDAWHKSQGYRARRASEAYVYHQKLGPKATFRHNVIGEDNG